MSELFVGAIIVSMILVLVRPNSNGPAAITALGKGFAGLFATATGA